MTGSFGNAKTPRVGGVWVWVWRTGAGRCLLKGWGLMPGAEIPTKQSKIGLRSGTKSNQKRRFSSRITPRRPGVIRAARNKNFGAAIHDPKFADVLDPRGAQEKNQKPSNVGAGAMWDLGVANPLLQSKGYKAPTIFPHCFSQTGPTGTTAG